MSGFERTCVLTDCGSVFKVRTQGSTQKFCSVSCAQRGQVRRGAGAWSEARRAVRFARVCEVCDKAYESDHPRSKYCSKVCKRTASRTRTSTYCGPRGAEWAEKNKERLRLIEETNGRCMICHEQFDPPLLYRDHDHSTEETRGILCPSCNFGLGNFKDSIENLRSAIAYLERSRTCAS